MDLRQRVGPQQNIGNRNEQEPSIKTMESTTLKTSNWSQLIYVVAVVMIFLWVLQSNFGLVEGHSHSHSHDDHNHEHHHHDHEHYESPSYRYSRAANEKTAAVSYHYHFL